MKRKQLMKKQEERQLAERIQKMEYELDDMAEEVELGQASHALAAGYLDRAIQILRFFKEYNIEYVADTGKSLLDNAARKAQYGHIKKAGGPRVDVGSSPDTEEPQENQQIDLPDRIPDSPFASGSGTTKE
jgi:hypothetical protein